MMKLEWIVTLALWLFSLLMYFVLAAWVGEGNYHEGQVRFAAVMGGVLWAYFSAIIIHINNLPKKIAEAMMEDDSPR